MATLKNSKPKKGMKLHTYLATGGDIKKFEGANCDFGTTKENSTRKAKKTY